MQEAELHAPLEYKIGCKTVHQKLQISIMSGSSTLQHDNNDLSEDSLPDSPQTLSSPTHLQFTTTDTTNTNTVDSGFPVDNKSDKSVSSMSTALTPDYIQMSLLVQN